MLKLTPRENYDILSVSTKLAFLYKEIYSILNAEGGETLLNEFLYLISEVEVLEKNNLVSTVLHPTDVRKMPGEM